MSAPLAGKFQDHYDVLGVEPKAGSEAIQTAYARLSQRFHPQTGTHPDPQKFEAVTLAFEVLSDPQLRREFDKLKGVGGEEKPRFSGRPFFEAYGRDTNLRVALLCVLYDRRRRKPFTPSLSMRHLENILAVSPEELNFALWYLKQREMVAMDDKSSLYITPDGMDFLQNNPPDPDEVMRLIREAGPEASESADQAPAPVPAPSPVPVAERDAKPPITGAAARIGSLLAKRNVN
jgi:curved DNA-binding protein CbpA